MTLIISRPMHYIIDKQVGLGLHTIPGIQYQKCRGQAGNQPFQFTTPPHILNTQVTKVGNFMIRGEAKGACNNVRSRVS